MINPALDMTAPQGLAKDKPYEATVVDNDDLKNHDDKRGLGRIRARVPVLFDGIPDEMLPWAIPSNVGHTDGASSTSGSFSVPKVGSKVMLTFQNGSPMHPKYSPYTMDASTVPKEALTNYPNRTVHKFQNGAMMIVDTTSNDIIINNPGNVNITIHGNVNMQIDGNVSSQINGNVDQKINGSARSEIVGTSHETVDGDRNVHVKGSINYTIDGSYNFKVSGAYNDTAMGTRTIYTSGDDYHQSQGHMIRSAPRIDDNPGGSVGKPGDPAQPTAPTITKPLSN